MVLTQESSTGSTFVDATLSYLRRMREKPRTLAYEPPPGVSQTNAVYEARSMAIRDLRAFADETSLDREGFQFIRQGSQVRDFYDDEELRRVYFPEAERLIATVTGASRVFIFDHTRRQRIPGTKDRTQGAPRQTASSIHNDYTERSGPQRLRDMSRNDASLLQRGRFSIINLWRPIRGPVQDSPLAICDAQSVAQEDLVAADLVYSNRTGENYLVTYNSAHRWYYASALGVGEALIFRCYDSATDGRARFTPHAAFIDPTAPPDAPPRESLELRALVLYDEEHST
jgi:hypothetical protein